MSSLAGRLHALLIGVDTYEHAPLHGCVNDVDALQRILIERLSVKPADIVRLTSKDATRANIEAGLTRLARAEVQRDDRVLVFYSGHGTRVTTGKIFERRSREAILPIDSDADKANLLFDHELSAHLRNIAARTKNLTLMLDCCHSGGVFRLVAQQSVQQTVRFRATSADGIDVARISGSDSQSGSESRALGVSSDWAVIAACLADQQAREMMAADGMVRGALSSALLETLAQRSDEDLETIVWSELWWSLVSAVAAKVPSGDQTPLLLNAFHRPLFGGPPREGDVGIRVRRTDAKTYAIGAGTLAGLDNGAQLALYPLSEPIFFPTQSPPNTAMIEVEEATLSSAKGKLLTGDPPDLTRGRIVRPAPFDRVRVFVKNIDAATLEALKGSPLLEVHDDESKPAELSVVHDVLEDDLDRESLKVAKLTSLPIASPADALRIVEHAARHRAPLRWAKRCTDLPNVLFVRVLDCGELADQRDGYTGAMPPRAFAKDERGLIDVPPNRVCAFEVENRSGATLYITLLDCAASGRVQQIGTEAVPSLSKHIFWRNETDRLPFAMLSTNEHAQELDRFVAIGTTRPDASLSHLVIASAFQEPPTRSATRDRSAQPPPPDRWTADVVLVRYGSSSSQ